MSRLGGIRAAFLASEPALPDLAADFDPAAGWYPLRQSWLGPEPARDFQPGWARVHWNPGELVYDMAFAGNSFGNLARRLNDRTWELGDVAEIFVEAIGTGYYQEIHVTPENQRLQLRFPHGGIAEVRAGRRTLEEFLIPKTDWVHSRVWHPPGWLLMRVSVPASVSGVERFAPGSVLRTAICRYDCSATGSPPRLSSTAALSAPSFHCSEEWSPLVLLPPFSEGK